ncbi:MAG TPA: alkaline phosphatase D family protein [Dermatophilaceae bacterium]|nr:alkaline phosphatase D family protein [Dermatophilaceae bacterium]
MNTPISRRLFLTATSRLAAAAGWVAAIGTDRGAGASAADVVLTRVDAVPTTLTRTWLAPEYWANRVGDWRLSSGRIESLTSGSGGRTVGVLTRRITSGDLAGAISMRTGTLASGTGFSGFLVGTGGGALDWRAAAVVMAASGRGGGLIAAYDSDGHVRFREHTSESDQFAYASLPVTRRAGPAPARRLGEDVELRLDLVPLGAGRFDLVLTARDAASGALLSTATRPGAEAELVGGLSLISTPTSGAGVRHWMRALSTGGPKIAADIARRTGPVLGTLYSLNRSVLKLTAQFMPIGATDPQTATLQVRAAGTTTWRARQSVGIGAGFTALFRVADWDGTKEWDYRIAYAVGTAQEQYYTGTVRKNPPASGQLSIGMINCTIHTFRPLDRKSSGASNIPGERFLGLYTRDNLYFPYGDLVRNLGRQRPDLLVAFGDQYYENWPTRRNIGNGAELDVLSRYYLWLWSFGELTRNTPTVCLVDDHDVYHGNLWGWSGKAAPNRNQSLGGYIMPPAWVNVVQRIQCSHNPDPYDPAPVLQGISVYYSTFSYGGVSFAVLEDRKFKNTNKTGTDQFGNPLPEPRDLLGARQEKFLGAWAAMNPGQPRVCLTQTVFACVQTNPRGFPVSDPDSNGSPVGGRRTAVRLLRDAGALVLSGDQHLASLIRHGLTTFTDGPVQFSAPAAGTAYQRWFQPARQLPNATGPNTGDFTDGFGNKLRVLAVANPKVSYATVHAAQPNDNNIGDRVVKSEGYGIVRINHADATVRLECWPWDEDPTAATASQFPGWPRVLPLSSL